MGVKAGEKILRSDAADSKLVATPAVRPDETTFKVEGPRAYDIVIRSEGPSLEVSLRELARRTDTSVALVEADILAGSEPLRARLDGVEDDVQQMVSGRAATTLNDSIYDRFRDQALKVIARQTQFTPTRSGFRLTAGGLLRCACMPLQDR